MSIAWGAGYLEGEGSFGWDWALGQNGKRYGRPRIHFASTDPDVAAKLAKEWKVSVQGPYRVRGKLPYYPVVIANEAAVKEMRRLYSRMGARRQATIAWVLGEWRKYKSQPFGKKGKV